MNIALSRKYSFVLLILALLALLALTLALLSSTGHLDLGHYALAWGGSVSPNIMYGN